MKLLFRYAIASLAIIALVSPAEAAKKRTGRALAKAEMCMAEYDAHIAALCTGTADEKSKCESEALINLNNCLDAADRLPGGKNPAMVVTRPGQVAPGGNNAPLERPPIKRTPEVTSGNPAPVERATPTPGFALDVNAQLLGTTAVKAEPTKPTTKKKSTPDKKGTTDN
jgi:hypothetical protein